MSTNKHFDWIAVISVILCFAVTVAFINGEALGLTVNKSSIGYEERLFDTSRVHTIDLVVDDWDSFLETCTDEEYVVCSAVIDGESYKNLAIRAKGNTSLSNVASLNSSRYSFKLEFDHYDSNKTYHGLDKICLNNLIQDNTYMKDYLAYTLMEQFGVDAPLCSFAYITVNGEDWGLYLAVEAIEDAFLSRNYGNEDGDLYKPDSLSFGGGRGNGKDFDMGNFMEENNDTTSSETDESTTGTENNGNTQNNGNNAVPQKPEDSQDNSSVPQKPDDNSGNSSMPQMPNGFDENTSMPEMPDGMTPPDGFTLPDNISLPDGVTLPDNFSAEKFGNGGGMGDMSMGSSDVKLCYIDDDASSYSNIFNNAKTTVTNADQKRLINALKNLTNYENLEETLDIDEVLRYFVVHQFTVNGDSYTGSMIHNYYLYESDGLLSMIPWDYNLAYGTFQGNNASSSVNDPIDDQLTDRPMQGFIFSSETYTELYHTLFAEFLSTFDFEEIIDTTDALIRSYVQKDPTAFCTFEEYEKGVSALKSFCTLRAQSITGQLDGSIPSTGEAQKADSSTLIDTADLNLSDMGTMNNGTGGGMDRGNGMGVNMPEQNRQTPNGDTQASSEETQFSADNTQSDDFALQDNSAQLSTQASALPKATVGTLSVAKNASSQASAPGNNTPPNGMTPPDGMEMPEGMTPPEGMEMPEGMTPPNGETASQATDATDTVTNVSSQDIQPQKPNEENSNSDGNQNSNADDNNSVGAQNPQQNGEENTTQNANEPGGMKNNRGGNFENGDFSFSQNTQGNSSGTYILLGVSVLILALGLLIAFKYRY